MEVSNGVISTAIYLLVGAFLAINFCVHKGEQKIASDESFIEKDQRNGESND